MHTWPYKEDLIRSNKEKSCKVYSGVPKGPEHWEMEQVLKKKLFIKAETEGIIAHHPKIDLKDCSYIEAEAWNIDKNFENNLEFLQIRSFKRSRETRKKRARNEEDVSLEEMRQLLLEISDCTECSAEDVRMSVFNLILWTLAYRF